MKNKQRLFSALALLFVLLAFVALYLFARDGKTQETSGKAGIFYEHAVIDQILTETTEEDPVAEGHERGEQLLIVTVKTGEHKGEQLLTDNTVGPIYGEGHQVGDVVTVGISTYEDGTVRCAVYEYNRMPALIVILLLFVGITVAVGGKTGVKSIVGLVLTVLALLFILLPLLLKGWAVIPTTFLVCVLVAVASFVLLSGVEKKSLCAMAGTLAGILLATLFGLFAQSILHIDGYRQEHAEALLQLRQTGESMIGISGLVTAGVIISALGAVMDVAMSISSAMQEVKAQNPALATRELFRSGMNIGRDMVGTMTNTLILAILGSGLTLIVYIYSLGLQPLQFVSSSYVALEAISAVASSVGVMLAVPLTALIAAVLYGRPVKKTGGAK